MITNYDLVKYRIYSIIVAFVGMTCFIFDFVAQFAVHENTYVMLVVSFLAIVAGSFAHKKSNLIVLGIAIVYCFLFYISLRNGFAVFYNSLSDRIAEYYNIDTYYLLIEELSEDGAYQGHFVYPFLVLISYYIGYCYANRRLIWLSATLFFAAFVFCIVIEIIPSGLIITLNLVYLIMVVVSENAGRLKKGNLAEHGTSMLASLITGFIIFAVLAVSMFINPESTYERPDLAAKYGDSAISIYKHLQDFNLYGVWDDLVNNIPASIGGGNIGDMDTVRYADKVVLSLKVPQGAPSIYLKAYVGADYTSTQWYKVETDGYEDLFESLDHGSQFHTQDMPVELLKIMVEESEYKIKFNTFGMSVTNKDATTKFGYIPSYAYIDPDKYGMKNDQAVYSSKQKDAYYDYYDFNINVLPELEKYVNSTNNEQVLKFEEYEQQYRPFVYDKYLEVNTPIADELTAKWGSYSINSAEDRLTVAAAIKKYLSANYTYTLSPGRVPSDVDFVEYFLNDTKEGYCTYFASAAVMMLRSAGIPARYVEGYLMKSSVTGDKTDFKPNTVHNYSEQAGGYYSTDYKEAEVLDSNGHAWVEFYLDGIGWIPYEMTPGNGRTTIDYEHETTKPMETRPVTTQPATSKHDQETTTSPSGGSSQKQTKPAVTTESDSNTGSSFKIDFRVIVTILKILAILIALSVAVAFVYLRHKYMEKQYKLLYNSQEPADQKILTIYRRFEKLMAFQGFKMSKFLQPTDYVEEIENRCRHIEPGEAALLMTLFQKASYSDEDMTAEEFKTVYDTVRVIRDRVYSNLGVFRKIWFVYILNL